MKRIVILLLVAVGLVGCSVDPMVYKNNQPSFRIEDYFAGHVRAWGMVQDRSGKVTRRMVVDLTGRREGDDFVLHEQFRYLDGKTETRDWHIIRVDAHHYIGRAADIVGVAHGEAYGNALHWHYTLKVPVDGETYELKFNDWMILHEDGVLLNRASFSKFGFHLGDVTIAFRKQDDGE